LRFGGSIWLGWLGAAIVLRSRSHHLDEANDMKAHDTPYTITYSRPDGGVETPGMMWADVMPTEEEVAIVLREQFLGSAPLVLTDSPRHGAESPTVKQLREHGFVIKHIIRAL
jgi:hypothetical protein